MIGNLNLRFNPVKLSYYGNIVLAQVVAALTYCNEIKGGNVCDYNSYPIPPILHGTRHQGKSPSYFNCMMLEIEFLIYIWCWESFKIKSRTIIKRNHFLLSKTI
jgi:hypothetical protein